MRLLWVILIGALSALAFYLSSQPGKDKRPNILIFISDDQSWGHTSMAGDPVVKTPNFDRIAVNGVNFTNAYNNAPACAPSRASMLSGKNFWELEEGAIHFSFIPKKFKLITDWLAESGYVVGYTGKGWAPGRWKGYRENDPSGVVMQKVFYDSVPKGINRNNYAANFKEFYKTRGNAPFYFMLGTTEPHRDLAKGMGLATGLDLARVKVPGFLPDHEIIRNDLLDYYYEIQWFDRQIGEVLDFLEANGELENTLVIVTSDNGMAFPRAKSNLYDYGSRLPLAIMWPGIVKGGVERTDFVSLKDLAPTILNAAQIKIPSEMTGNNLMPILTDKQSGRSDKSRNFVVMGKELHAWCHPEGEINPVRAIRTDEYLYIHNLKPHMWPAGHPDPQYSWDLMPFGDVDDGPSKDFIILNRNDSHVRKFFELAFQKRPSEELYHIPTDPFQLDNLAYKPGFQEIKGELVQKMQSYLIQTGDPRTLGKPDVFDHAPYFWSHGFKTGGLPLDQWSQLSDVQKGLIQDSLKEVLSHRKIF
ncbi:MAG: sulfatase [Cyclobacteriaceae bacterium]|nr:sulfatase [Cyclobacteriaceae bacterium]